VDGLERVQLPTGDWVWVRRPVADADVGGPAESTDVGLGTAVGQAAQLAQMPGFVSTVAAVVDSARLALARHRPDRVEVEFGLELSARSGAVLAVLGQAGGGAHVKITACWDRSDERPDGTGRDSDAGAGADRGADERREPD
jgi:hypothetical protein